MFAGIIEDLGSILKKNETSKGVRLAIRFEKIHPHLKIGESVAVNGICLTAAKIIPRGFEADVVRETLQATTLGWLKSGAKVNLERALRFGDRMGGHTVSGHVDGRGRVTRRIRQGRQQVLFLRVPATIHRFCLPKGSIAINGVSLTLQSATRGMVKIALIPHTLKITTLGSLREGDFVNIEADRLARRALWARPSGVKPRCENFRMLKRRLKVLKRQGF